MSAPSRRNGALVKHIERGCTEKLRYPDELTARAAGQYDQQRFDHVMYVYKCQFCKGWHLTTKKTSPKWRADAGLK